MSCAQLLLAKVKLQNKTKNIKVLLILRLSSEYLSFLLIIQYPEVIEIVYSKCQLVDFSVCLSLCDIFEKINESQKSLEWSNQCCHLPSTEKPILLGFSLLFTLAGLHLLLLPVTAIKISSRSAIMVSSCHCVDKKGKVQYYWNVLD